MSCQCSSHSQITMTLVLEASLITNGMDNFSIMRCRLCLISTEHIPACAYKLASPSYLLSTTTWNLMAPNPKSRSAKQPSVPKLKSKSSATKVKQDLLNGHKSGQYIFLLCGDHLQHSKNIAVSLSMKKKEKDRKLGKCYICFLAMITYCI
jgi:hypothetical protein